MDSWKGKSDLALRIEWIGRMALALTRFTAFPLPLRCFASLRETMPLVSENLFHAKEDIREQWSKGEYAVRF